MKRRFSCLILFLLLGLPGAIKVRAQSQTLDRKHMEWLGVTRFSDLLRVMGSLRTTSMDGHALIGFSTGSPGSIGGAPGILVDGMEASFMTLGSDHMVSYGFVPSDLDALSWSPGLHVLPSGRVVDGVIRLRTHRPSGFAVRGTIAAVNPTGDPGPAAYLGSDRANVDRSGPTWNLRLSQGSDRWFAEVGLLQDEHHGTDRAIINRVTSTYNGLRRPFRRVRNGFARVTHTSDRIRVDARAGRTSVEDLNYSPAIGREWPLSLNRTWVLTRTRLSRSPGRSVTLTTRGEILEAANRASRIFLPPPPEGRRGAASLTWRSEQGRTHGMAAIGGSVSELSQAGSFETGLRPIAFSMAGISFPIGPEARAGFDLLIRDDRSEPDLPLTGSLRTSLSGQVGMRAHARVEAALVRERPDPWTDLTGLMASGFAAAPLGSDFSRTDTRSPSDHADLSLAIDRSIGPDLTLSFGASIRRSRDLLLQTGRLDWVPREERFVRDSTLVDGQRGTLTDAWISINWQPTDRVKVLGLAQAHTVRSDDEAFDRSFQTFPGQRLVLQLFHEPVRRLRTHILAEWRSAWEARLYSDRRFRNVPRYLRIDVTVQKDLWEDVLTMGISLLNILDGPARTHPAGVDEQLAFRFHVRATFSDR